jgi:hypothetical protein
LKPIEEIKKGDEVLSYNEQTGQNEYQPVLQTFERFASDVLSIKIENEEKSIGVTGEHPFFARNNLSSEDGEWIKAGELQIGDEILKSDGTWAIVESVVSRSNDKVYNFEVSQNHNYFVGEQSLLVHNTCGDYLAKKAPKQVTPGTKKLSGQRINDQGRIEPWEAHYDQYGRQIGRTDYNAGNATQGIPSTHHHKVEFNSQYPNGIETGSHIPGPYPR